MIGEYDANGDILRRYVYASGGGIDEPLMLFDYTGQSVESHYYHSDARGSIVALSDDEGQNVEQYSYSPYGEASILNATTGQPYRYTGREYDEETGLYYYRARYYAPRLGRFLQTDPIGYKDNLNLYAYVGNDPLNLSDPSGKRATIVDGNIVIQPEDNSVPSVTIPNTVRAEGFGFGIFSFLVTHQYTVSTPSNIPAERAADVGRAIQENPTPGNDSTATPRGTRNDVGYLPLSDGTNMVKSFSVESPDPSKYTDITVNYTIKDQHDLDEGFVMKYGEIQEDGTITLRSYGEGNGLRQIPTLEPLWNLAAQDVWQENHEQIMRDLEEAMPNGCGYRYPC